MGARRDTPSDSKKVLQSECQNRTTSGARRSEEAENGKFRFPENSVPVHACYVRIRRIGAGEAKEGLRCASLREIGAPIRRSSAKVRPRFYERIQTTYFRRCRAPHATGRHDKQRYQQQHMSLLDRLYHSSLVISSCATRSTAKLFDFSRTNISPDMRLDEVLSINTREKHHGGGSLSYTSFYGELAQRGKARFLLATKESHFQPQNTDVTRKLQMACSGHHCICINQQSLRPSVQGRPQQRLRKNSEFGSRILDHNQHEQAICFAENTELVWKQLKPNKITQEVDDMGETRALEVRAVSALLSALEQGYCGSNSRSICHR